VTPGNLIFSSSPLDVDEFIRVLWLGRIDPESFSASWVPRKSTSLFDRPLRFRFEKDDVSIIEKGAGSVASRPACLAKHKIDFWKGLQYLVLSWSNFWASVTEIPGRVIGI